MNLLQSIDRWHKTRKGHLVFGLVELGLAYIVASLAIDSGSLLQYTVTIFLFIGSIHNFVRIFQIPKHERAKH